MRVRLTLIVVVAWLAFAAAAAAWTVDYNFRVAEEQLELMKRANNGMIIVGNGAQDPRSIYRTWFMLLSLASAGMLTVQMFRSRSPLILPAIGLSMVMLGIAVAWVAGTMQALEMAEFYRVGDPYLLKIATPFDWLFFALLLLTFAVQVTTAYRTNVLRRRPTPPA